MIKQGFFMNRSSLFFVIIKIICAVMPGILLAAPISGARAPMGSTPITRSVAKVPPAKPGAEAYLNLPARFERNSGQCDPQVKFFSRGSGYGLFLTNTEAVFAFISDAPAASVSKPINSHGRKSSRVDALQMRLSRANRNAQPVAVGQSRGEVNYFLSKNPKLWKTERSTYSQISYNEVYGGIDLVYHGNGRQLEFDFVVSPGADPKKIAFTFGSKVNLSVAEGGSLIVAMKGRTFEIRAPVAFQTIGGVRHEVASRFVLRSKTEVGFELGTYQKDEQLTIDPVLGYSTYLGGTGFTAVADETINGIAVDQSGNAYVVGTTISTDFPVVNAFKPNGGGFSDAFVSKINPSGTALVYSTYLGGNRNDLGLGIAVDSTGSAYVTGESASLDFPTTPGAFKTTGLDTDVFVSKISPAGNALVYSTLLSGDRIVLPNAGGTLASAETGYAIAVDGQGQAYVTGSTQSGNFATPNAFQTSGAGGRDAFLAKVNTTGSALIFCTYIGGSMSDEARSIALDNAGNAYIVGDTSSTDYRTTPGSLKPSGTFMVAGIGFVSKFSPDGSNLVYSTFLGDQFERTRGVAVDSSGNAFVTGETNSDNFPVTSNALRSRRSRGALFKSSDDGVNWVGVGFPGDFAVNGVAVDPSNQAKLYAATEGGVFRTVDGGTTWSQVGPAINMLTVAVDPSSPTTIISGANGQGIFKSIDGGNTWTNPVATGTVFTLTFHPQTSGKVFAGLSAAGLQSADSGEHWSPFGVGGSIRAIRFDPTNFNTIYLASNGAINRSLDGGVTWSSILGQPGGFYGVVVDPQNSLKLYAANHVFGMFTSIDGGQNWGQFNSGLASGHLNSLNTIGTSVIVGLEDLGVYKLSGSNWVPTGLIYSTVNSLAVANVPQPTLYAGSFVGSASDAYLSELNASGSALLYSTYLGGTGYDSARGVALDVNGDATVVGVSASLDLPLRNQVKTKAASATDAFITKISSASGDLVFSSYLGGNGVDNATAVAVDSAGNILVAGSTRSNNFPTVAAFQPTLRNIDDSFVSKILLTPPPVVQFSGAPLSVSEGDDHVTLQVHRVGDSSLETEVSYRTQNETASQSSDFTAALGKLKFAPGETSKSVSVFLTDDALIEGPETFSLVLFNATNANVGAAAQITILDNDSVPNAPNPIDSTAFYVRQHYHDFLSREPDPSGLAFWIDNIESCGQDLPCRQVKRINTSAAFFLSIEFQNTGYFVYRMYKTAYGDTTSPNVSVSVPIVRFQEFLTDTQRVGSGVVVGQGEWQNQIEANKAAYAVEFVQRPSFQVDYPVSMTPFEFVSKLDQRAGGVLSFEERTNLVASFGVDPGELVKRANAVRAIAEDSDLQQREFNRSFVLMQYFGYLRRNPDEAPDSDFRGWEFWLNKLNQFHGNFVDAEMVKAFLESGEYRHRFGP